MAIDQLFFGRVHRRPGEAIGEEPAVIGEGRDGEDGSDGNALSNFVTAAPNIAGLIPSRSLSTSS